MRNAFMIATAFSLTLACSGSSKTGATAGAPAAQPTRSGNRDIITREEIEQQQGVTNAFDLVRRLRPRFFDAQGRTSITSASQTPLVRLDGSLLGDISMLRSIEIGGIQEIRYYSIVEAETKWSGDRGRPVIAVTTRK